MYTQLCYLFLQTVQQQDRTQPRCIHSRDTEQRVMQLRAGSNAAEAAQNVVITQLTELAEMHTGGYSQSACETSMLHAAPGSCGADTCAYLCNSHKSLDLSNMFQLWDHIGLIYKRPLITQTYWHRFLVFLSLCFDLHHSLQSVPISRCLSTVQQYLSQLGIGELLCT